MPVHPTIIRNTVLSYTVVANLTRFVVFLVSTIPSCDECNGVLMLVDEPVDRGCICLTAKLTRLLVPYITPGAVVNPYS